MKNIVFTLAYNLPSEVNKVSDLLYGMNDCGTFEHWIVDLGFPILEGNVIPDDFAAAKEENSKRLKKIADVHGSEYVKMENIGVSQNWSQICKYLKLDDLDVVIGQDPDEHPLTRNWVKAMGDVIREGDFGMASLMMTDHVGLIKNTIHSERFIGGHRVYCISQGSFNWALIGLSGKFFNKLGEIPYPPNAKRYGWIEGALLPKFTEHKMGWCIMADFRVKHTDFELGDPGTSQLLRLWKNQIIFNIHQYGQMSFEEFLTMKKLGTL